MSALAFAAKAHWGYDDALRIEADPFAAQFYDRMGAKRIGEAPSASIPGRVLPLYRIGLSSTG